MAKQIGSLGVTVSANTIGLQRGFSSAAAEVRQFSATARVAGAVAGQFDSAMVRLGADTASFASQMRLAVPGITAGFASMAGILVGLVSHFKQVKEMAISAATAAADFFTKTHAGLDFQGLRPDTGPQMSSDAMRRIAEAQNEAAFTRGEIDQRTFLERKNRIGGMGVFDSQQLAQAELSKQAAEEQRKQDDERTQSRLKAFQTEADAERDMRRQNMIAAKEAQDEFKKFEHEKRKEAEQTRKEIEQMAQEVMISAGARRSQFESDPTKRAILQAQEQLDALRGGSESTKSFGISSQSFLGDAPVGQLIGQQREQEETNGHLEDIKAGQLKLIETIKKLVPGLTVTD